jgi:Flp pilus assembly protein TadD
MLVRPLILRASAIASLAVALSACQTTGAKTGLFSNDPVSTASTTSAEDAKPSFKRTEALKQKYTANPSDTESGLAYAKSLGALGQPDAQSDVLRSLANTNPSNGALLADAGKQALEAGHGGQAVSLLERAAALPNPSWQTLNALGSAYDQQGRHDVAREQYQRALSLNPKETSIENNMGMSLALEGKLPEAESQLRTLLGRADSKSMPKVRQNLALVVGLQGRFEEARTIASEDLPPDQVEANLAYLQQMLEQPNTWQQLSEPQQAQAQ